MDIETVRKHAISNGGLVSSELRKKAWPKMVGVSVYDILPYDGKGIGRGGNPLPDVGGTPVPNVCFLCVYDRLRFNRAQGPSAGAVGR